MYALYYYYIVVVVVVVIVVVVVLLWQGIAGLQMIPITNADEVPVLISYKNLWERGS